MHKAMWLRFDRPAADTDYDWERRSFPMGNGYMGVNLFGGVSTERLQITENSLVTCPSEYIKWHWCCGLENFAELYIDFPHAIEQVSDYERTLCLNTGIATVTYQQDGVTYTRETFGSYPDRVWALRLTASRPGALQFRLRPYSPHNRDWLMAPGDGRGKHGKCVAAGNTVVQTGESEHYRVQFEGQYTVILEQGGTCTAQNDAHGENGTLTVENATSAVIFVAVGTNYRLTPEVFSRQAPEKLQGYPHPHEMVSAAMAAAIKKGYDAVKESHLADFTGYFDRVELDLGGTQPTVSMDTLKEQYRQGDKNPYLVELLYQMGRYAMLCSSREGCLPPNLQGIWNVFEIPPWTAGYWYNINIQMSYWPVFTSNLPEMFRCYEHFNRVRMERMEQMATEYIQRFLPENHTEGQGMDGWILGTGNSPYFVSGCGGHSGPGTGGLTTKAYWDYYDFTRDPEILRRDVFPVLQGMARFYTKFAEKQPDGTYLCKISSSPEQMQNGKAYQTIGCAFDQQMMYENNRDFLRAAELLGDDPLVDRALVALVRQQLDHYDPVQVGYSGQVKEFREEQYYGDIGEKGHRHISHMVGVAPGTQINAHTPAWLDAAGVSMEGRGATHVCWGNVHRMMAWARIGNGVKCQEIVERVLNGNVYPNMLSGHNPNDCFQIEGVFGITAAIGETLLQSHEDCLHLLPALPPEWPDGSVQGLAARGRYTVDLCWAGGCLTEATIHAGLDDTCRVLYPTATDAAVTVTDSAGQPVPHTAVGAEMIAFPVKAGETYRITGLPPFARTADPAQLTVDAADWRAVRLSWTAAEPGATYTVYRAMESAPTYETLAEGLTDGCFTDTAKGEKQATYKVVATAPGKIPSYGKLHTVIPASETPREVAFGEVTHVPEVW